MRTDMTKLIFTFRSFVKLSNNIAAYTRNRVPLEVTEGKNFTDRYLSPKLHSSKNANTI